MTVKKLVLCLLFLGIGAKGLLAASPETLSDEAVLRGTSALCGSGDLSGNNGANETGRRPGYWTSGLRPYRDNYFLPYAYDFSEKDGRSNGEAKFQISFTVPIRRDLPPLGQSLLFAYTQVSCWQLWQESSPFRETNYEPEAFLSFESHLKQPCLEYLKEYRLGYVHQSNGQGGLESRSWDRLYAQGICEFKGLRSALRVWGRIKRGVDDNPDIEDYMGYGDLKMSYTHKTKSQKEQRFGVLVRNNLDFSENKGALELDWSFPFGSIPLLGGAFRWLRLENVHGYLQYFTGYGETLIDYDRSVSRLGMGVQICTGEGYLDQ